MPQSTPNHPQIDAIKSWSNSDNIAFYENMPLQHCIDVVKDGGLDNNCDVTAAKQYIDAAHSILEIGAGYGRALQSIIDMGYKKKALFAIERDRKLYQHLIKRFPTSAEIIHSDIKDFNTNYKFDLILWLWTGICEFSKNEQPQILSKLINFLTPRGHIIIDLIPVKCKALNTTNFDQSNRIIKTPFGVDYIYIPSEKELKQHAKTLGMKNTEVITYKTRTNKIRKLYIFTI
jgi:phospholipid N-methyltransferase